MLPVLDSSPGESTGTAPPDLSGVDTGNEALTGGHPDVCGPDHDGLTFNDTPATSCGCGEPDGFAVEDIRYAVQQIAHDLFVGRYWAGLPTDPVVRGFSPSSTIEQLKGRIDTALGRAGEVRIVRDTPFTFDQPTALVQAECMTLDPPMHWLIRSLENRTESELNATRVGVEPGFAGLSEVLTSGSIYTLARFLASHILSPTRPMEKYIGNVRPDVASLLNLVADSYGKPEALLLEQQLKRIRPVAIPSLDYHATFTTSSDWVSRASQCEYVLADDGGATLALLVLGLLDNPQSTDLGRKHALSTMTRQIESSDVQTPSDTRESNGLANPYHAVSTPPSTGKTSPNQTILCTQLDHSTDNPHALYFSLHCLGEDHDLFALEPNAPTMRQMRDNFLDPLGEYTIGNDPRLAVAAQIFAGSLIDGRLAPEGCGSSSLFGLSRLPQSEVPSTPQYFPGLKIPREVFEVVTTDLPNTHEIVVQLGFLWPGYVPPAVLEKIANKAGTHVEHKPQPDNYYFDLAARAKQAQALYLTLQGP